MRHDNIIIYEKTCPFRSSDYKYISENKTSKGLSDMKRIAICDDNDLQREILAEMLRQYFRRIYQKVELVEYNSGDTLVADMEEDDLHVELIFLDIYMPGKNGIETAQKLRLLSCDAELVFLTSSTEHALESYEVKAAGYLVKPVEMNRLCALLNQILWGGC